MKTDLAGSVAALEIPIKDMQTFAVNGVRYYWTTQTMHTPYQVAWCEIVDNKFVMHLIHTFIQSFQITDFVFFYNIGAIGTDWNHVGSYPCKNKMLHVFKTFGLKPPTVLTKK